MRRTVLRVPLPDLGITAAQLADLRYGLLPRAGVIILGVVIGVLITVLLS
jgi:hypothetical protein